MTMSRVRDSVIYCLVWSVLLCPIAIVVFLFLVLGEPRQDKPSPADTTVTVSDYLRTVEHDGHWFVGPRRAGGLLHHPDCPCGKEEEGK